MDRKLIFWSIALFFGCSILFRVVGDATIGSGKGVSLAVQAGVLVLVIAIIVVVAKRRS